jgi:hypothetical protein
VIARGLFSRAADADGSQGETLVGSSEAMRRVQKTCLAQALAGAFKASTRRSSSSAPVFWSVGKSSASWCCNACSRRPIRRDHEKIIQPSQRAEPTTESTRMPSAARARNCGRVLLDPHLLAVPIGWPEGVINQIRGFLIERGITVRQGPAPLRKALSDVLNSSSPTLSPRMVRLIADLSEDWRRLDNRIAIVSAEIEALVE